MKITQIDIFTFHAPLRTPFVTALRKVESLSDVVLRIQTDTEIVGWGEAAPIAQITSETTKQVLTELENISRGLVGLDLSSDFETLKTLPYQNTYKSTQALIEGALYDAVSKQQNIPLYQKLSDRSSIQAPATILQTDVTLSIADKDTLLDQAQKYYDQGFRHFKIKLDKNACKEIKKVRFLAKKLPNDVYFRLDANQSWSSDETICAMQELESEGLTFECLEQPVKADDLAGLQKIKHRIATPLLADESVLSVADAAKIIKAQACDMINIKLTKLGGFTQAEKLVDLCRKEGISCMMGCMLEGPVAIASSLHFASCNPDVVRLIDLDGAVLLLDICASGTLELQTHTFDLNGSYKGIGITPRDDALEHIASIRL